MSIQSDIKISKSITTIVVRPEVGANNNFRRLPVTMQQAIATYLDCSDLDNVSFVDRLFKQNMADPRIWRLLAKQLGIETYPLRRPTKDIQRFYNKVNKTLFGLLPESIKKQITAQQIKDPNPIKLYKLSEETLNKTDLTTLNKDEMKACGDAVLKLYSHCRNESRQITIPFELLIRAGLIRMLKSLPDVNDQRQKELILMHYMVRDNQPLMAKLIATEILHNRDFYKDLSSEEREILTAALRFAYRHNHLDLFKFLLAAGVILNKKSLGECIDDFYINVFQGGQNIFLASESPNPSAHFPLLISYCSRKEGRILLSRIDNWQFYPKLLSDALDFARQFNPQEAPALVEALQKVRGLDWIKEQILKAVPDAAVSRDEDEIDTSNLEEYKFHLIQDALGIAKNKGNVAALKVLLKKPPLPSPFQLTLDLMNNSELIRQLPERIPFQKALFEAGAISTAETLNRTLQWESYLTFKVDDLWEMSLKSASLKDRIAVLAIYTEEKSKFEKMIHICEEEKAPILKDYDKLIASLKDALKLSESDLKSEAIQKNSLGLKRPDSCFKLELEWVSEKGFFRWWMRQQVSYDYVIKTYLNFVKSHFRNPRKHEVLHLLLYQCSHCLSLGKYDEINDLFTDEFIDSTLFGIFDASTAHERKYLKSGARYGLQDSLMRHLSRTDFEIGVRLRIKQYAFMISSLAREAVRSSEKVKNPKHEGYTPKDYESQEYLAWKEWNEANESLDSAIESINDIYSDLRRDDDPKCVFTSVHQLRSPLTLLQWSYKGFVGIHLGNWILFKHLLQLFLQEFSHQNDIPVFMKDLFTEVLTYQCSLQFIQPLLDAGFKPTYDHLLQAANEHLVNPELPKLISVLIKKCSPEDVEKFKAAINESYRKQAFDFKILDCKRGLNEFHRIDEDIETTYIEKIRKLKDQLEFLEKAQESFLKIKKILNVSSSCCVVQ